MMRGALQAILGLAGFLLAWEALARTGALPENLFPHVAEVARAFAGLVVDGELTAAAFHTLLRAVAGLAISVLLALAFGMVSALSPLVRRMLGPFVDVCRTLPPAALVPLLVFALGLGARMFMVVIVCSALWPIYLAVVAGLTQTEPLQLATARSFGASPAWVVARVRLPAAMPAICAGVRVGLGLSLMATIASEMIAGSDGIGFLLLDTAFSLRIPEMYATLAAAGLLGLALNSAVLAVQRPIILWYRASTAPVGA